MNNTPIRLLLGILLFAGTFVWYYYADKKNPDKIFTAAWGSINMVATDSDFETYFKDYRRRQKDGTMKVFNKKEKNFVDASSYTEYFTTNYIDYYEKRVKEVEKVRPGEDGKAMVAAAIDLYGLMDDIYKNDFPRITEMMDAGTPEEEVDAHIAELMDAKGGQVYEKYDALLDLLIEYAEKHEIAFNVH